MAFLPTSAGRAPIWNSDTDEVVVHVEGGVDTVVVPPECTYMVFSISDTTSGTNTVSVTPDSSSLGTGVILENAVGGDRSFGTAVAAGTSIHLRVPSLVADEADVNVTRYYTKK